MFGPGGAARVSRAVRAEDRRPAIGLSRMTKALRVKVCGDVAHLRLTGGAVALPRLQAPVVAVVLGVRAAPASTTTGATSTGR